MKPYDERRSRAWGRTRLDFGRFESHAENWPEANALLRRLHPNATGGVFTLLRGFQRSHGLPPTGRPDPATMAELVASIGRAAE